MHAQGRPLGLTLVIVLALLHLSVGDPLAKENRPAASARLPDNVIPRHYDLKLDLTEKDMIEGEVTMRVGVVNSPSERSKKPFGGIFSACIRAKSTDDLKCKRPASKLNHIVLHADPSIDIISVKYFTISDTSPDLEAEIVKLTIDNEYQQLTIVCKEELPFPSTGRLEIKFNARYNDKMRGIYHRTYSNDPSERFYYRYVASSFQPTGARLAFPCFDEPEFKATFSLSITHSKNNIALSNTRQLSIETMLTGDLVTTFEQTPQMPVHMVAVVVGDFDYIEQGAIGMRYIPMRVYTPKHMMHGCGEFALEVASRSLNYMERYTSVEFPLAKFDIVALADHDKDNTESWGLAVIRSNLVQFDEETTEDSKLAIAINVAHVVSHQWFGNLITALWWDSLWITEMVAAQNAFEIVESLYPYFNSRYFDRLNSLSKVLRMDSNGDKHPLSPELRDLQTSDQIYEIFDALQFMKSASLAQMLNKHLSRDNFCAVLKLLLEENQYKNVDDHDLSRAIDHVYGKSNTLKKFNPMIYKSGYPILKIDAKRRYDLFLSYPARKYIVPTNSIIFGDFIRGTSYEKFMITEGKIPKPKLLGPWFKVNPDPDISSYNRILYSDALLESNFKILIERKSIPPLDRLHLIDDAVGLVLSGHMQRSSLDKLLSYYENEDHDGVIMGLIEASEVLTESQGSDSSYISPAMISGILMEIYYRNGFQPVPQADFLNLRLQTLALNKLISMGNLGVIHDALQKFDESNGLIEELNLREPVYTAVVTFGSSRQVVKLLDRLEETRSYDEIMRLINSLVKTESLVIFRTTIRLFLNGNLPREVRARLYNLFTARPLGERHLKYIEFKSTPNGSDKLIEQNRISVSTNR